MTQSDFASKSLPIWLPLYRIEQFLTTFSYIIREVGTNYTQFDHQTFSQKLSKRYDLVSPSANESSETPSKAPKNPSSIP